MSREQKRRDSIRKTKKRKKPMEYIKAIENNGIN